jgi:site-specific DNA-cytosine methylase
MEVIGSIYTGVTADFQRGVYPIARCVKAEQYDLGVVMADVNVLGSLEAKFESTNRIYDVGGCSPTLSTMQGGNQEPKILESQIVAMRGRNPDNPSDRTTGSPTEQRLEINMQGTSNCLTSVQKDNMVLIKQATKSGSIECEVGGCFDASYPESQTRRGCVQDNGNTCPTLTAQNQEIVRIEKVGQISNDGSQCGTVYSDSGISPTLIAGTHGDANSKVFTQYRIRKLTPRECGRLMGVSDEDISKMAAVNSNTQLYKQFGNSIVVDVMCAMFRNLNIEQEVKLLN